jgi:hypothetical protein
MNTGGKFTIAGPIGLNGFFYGGDDGGAHNNFGGPDLPANTYTNYTTYFATRGGLEANAFTGANDVAVLSFDSTGGDTNMFAVYGQNRNNNIVSRMVGKIFIATAGTYTFGTVSDDGSMLYLDGNAVVSNNVYQGMTRRTGTISLTAGFHDIDIGFYEGGGGNGLVVEWAGPGITGTQSLPNSVLYPDTLPQQLGNAFNITGNSTITVSAAFGQIAGDFTMQSV